MRWIFISCRDNVVENVRVFDNYWDGTEFTDTFISLCDPSVVNYPNYNRMETYTKNNLTIGLYKEGIFVNSRS